MHVTPCPDLVGSGQGTVCELDGVRRTTLPLEPGFFRIGPNSDTILPCPSTDACLGTPIRAWR